RHHFDANAATVFVVGYDPKRVAAILRRWFASVGGRLFERNDAHAFFVRADRLDDLFVARAVVRPHEQYGSKFTFEMYGCVDAQLAQRGPIAYYDDLVP